MVRDFAHEGKTGYATPHADQPIFHDTHFSCILLSMDELERLQNLVGPAADGWTTTQLDELRRDIDAMAAILLDLYRSRGADRRGDGCGSPRFDVP
jgi:hypothetical protein